MPPKRAMSLAMQSATIEAVHSAPKPATDFINPRNWKKKLAPYRQAMPRRALVELALTAVPFAALWLAMGLNLSQGYWLTLLLALPAAGFLVRLFVIQHDCGHG